MWIDCSIQTQKLEGIPIFFPIAGFFLKMAANNQSSVRGVGKFTYQQQIGDSLVRGDITHLILLESNFSLPALCSQADLSIERKKQRKQEKESAISSNRTLLGIKDVPIAKAMGHFVLKTFCSGYLRPRMLLLSTALQTISDLDFLHLNPVPMNLNDATHEKNQHPYSRKEQAAATASIKPKRQICLL